MRNTQILDLTGHFNNDGISSDEDRTDGDFTGTGQTFPEEDLPPSNSRVTYSGVPFTFPDKSDGALNNISLEGQRLFVSKGYYERFFILGAADVTSLEDSLAVVSEQGMHHDLPLQLSSWRLGRNLKYGEIPAIRCSGFHFPSQHVNTERLDVTYGIWMQTILLPRIPITSILLPDNPGMHIFALTLEEEAA